MHHKNKYGTRCPECKKWTKLKLNGICYKCNKKFGLKECNSCHKLLFIIQDFYSKRSICIECLKQPLMDYLI